MGKYLQWLFILSFPVSGLLCGLLVPTLVVVLLGLVGLGAIWWVVPRFSGGASTVGSFFLLMILNFLLFLGLGWGIAVIARGLT